jgi:outer membrane biosynthesis protein TonB
VLAAAPAVLDTVSVFAVAAVDVVALDAGALDAGVMGAEAVGGADVGETPDGPVLPAVAWLAGADWDAEADPPEDPWDADPPEDPCDADRPEETPEETPEAPEATEEPAEEATEEPAEEATEEPAEDTDGIPPPVAWGTADAAEDPAVPGEKPPVGVPGSAAADAGRAKMTARIRTKMNAPARPLHVYRHRRSAPARIVVRPTLGGRA